MTGPPVLPDHRLSGDSTLPRVIPTPLRGRDVSCVRSARLPPAILTEDAGDRAPEPAIKSTRVHRATNKGASLPRRVTYFRRESHHRVTAVRRDRALANPPRSHAPALVGDRAGRRSAVSRPTVDKHLHRGRARDPPLEVLVERCVVSVHNNEQLGIRKRSRRHGFEKLFLMIRADAMGQSRVFERFAHTQVTRLSFSAAPGTEKVHRSVPMAANAVPLRLLEPPISGQCSKYQESLVYGVARRSTSRSGTRAELVVSWEHGYTSRAP